MGLVYQSLLIGSFFLLVSSGYEPKTFPQDVSLEEKVIDSLGGSSVGGNELAELLSAIRREQAHTDLPKHQFAYKPYEPGYANLERAMDYFDEEPKNKVKEPKYHMKRISDDKNDTNKDGVSSSSFQSVELRGGYDRNDIYFIATVAGCTVGGLVILIVVGVCWYRLQKNAKASEDAEYPAYGVTGPMPPVAKENVKTGDRKLAQYAHMYHYQHQKQQMIAMETQGHGERNLPSDVESEEENGETDDTVYECPGLAPTGELEVKNPLFQDDPTPMKEAPEK